MLTRLPHRVVIQTESRSLFQGGAYTTSWVTASTEWANVQPVQVKESYGDMKEQAYTKHRIIMRKNSTLSNKCRIIFGSRTFWVETVRDPTERGRMTEAICREENA